MGTLVALSITAALFLCFLLTAVFSKCNYFPSLNGRHVAVTGGSSGIGFSLAKRCLIEGAFVTLMARTEKNLLKAREALVEHVGCPSNRILLKAVDVSCPSAITAAINESFKWRPIDILVCNAGIAKGGFFDELAVEDLEAQYRINFLGSVYTIHAALPLMKQRSQNNPTSIVVMNSLCSLFFAGGGNTYMTSKYALKGLAELLKLQLKPFNIRVQMVTPGYTETAMLDEVEKFSSSAPLWRKLFMFKRENAQTTDEVAQIIVEAFKRGNFLTTTATDGFLLRVLGRGLLPEDTFAKGLLELVLLLPARIASILVIPIISMLIKRGSEGKRTYKDIY